MDTADRGRSTPRRHHTIPQFYLKGFARSEQVMTIRLPGQHSFLQSVRRAGSSTDYYAVPGHEDGDDVVERHLADIEAKAASALASVAAGEWPLSPERRDDLGYFIALQATRTPSHRQTMNYVAAQMMRLQIGAGGIDALARLMRQQDPDVTDEIIRFVWEQSTRAEGPPIELSPEAYIEQMYDTANEIFKFIVGRPWALLEFDRRSLITSDAPVGLVPNPDLPPHAGRGFLTAAAITFPLSRKRGLLMLDAIPYLDHVDFTDLPNGRLDMRQGGTTAQERLFNHNTAASAAEWLFLHPDDASFVPEDLPQPTPIKMRMSGPRDFDGSPWFGPSPGGP